MVSLIPNRKFSVKSAQHKKFREIASISRNILPTRWYFHQFIAKMNPTLISRNFSLVTDGIEIWYWFFPSGEYQYLISIPPSKTTYWFDEFFVYWSLNHFDDIFVFNTHTSSSTWNTVNSLFVLALIKKFSSFHADIHKTEFYHISKYICRMYADVSLGQFQVKFTIWRKKLWFSATFICQNPCESDFMNR